MNSSRGTGIGQLISQPPKPHNLRPADRAYESLVFLDETGVNTKMARLYGWAPVGERCRDRVPFGHWKTMTFIAGLRLTGMTAPWVLDGPMDGDAFRVYVRDVLAPTLRRGDVVVLDNLPAHKVAGIREAITARRAQLFYLPPYSPDMNPIEMAFAKLKALLRQQPARGGAMMRWLRLRRMRRAFRALPERDRAIFGSVRFDDLDYIEAARRHGCTVAEVEETITRVIIALDRALRGK